VESSAPSALWIAFAALAAVVALLQTGRIAWARLAREWSIHVRAARARRAVEGELAAEPILRRAGYEVLARQVRTSWTLYADEAPLAIGLRADLLVSRAGRTYVAEVKTGKLAPRLDHAPTRRQLLEYRIAFGVDGVLLVDAESERVTRVELGEAADRGGVSAGGKGWGVVFAAGLAIGAIVGWLLRARV
jgi:hypothetical protein